MSEVHFIDSVSNPAKEAVRCDGISKLYRGQDGVQGLDLVIQRGRKFGLLGPNGAGKSTTLKIMLGLLKHDHGEITILGNTAPFQSTSLRSRIGYVPERHYLYKWMQICEIIKFTRAFYPHWNDRICDELINKYGLKLDKQVGELSHGMLTKLALILALSHEPEMLILDEPTTGLDPIIREEFLEGILQPLSESSEQTIIYSSHIMSDIETISDTIAILNEGKLLVCESKQNLLDNAKLVSLKVGPDFKFPGNLSDTFLQRKDGDVEVYTIRGFNEQKLNLLQQNKHVQILEIAALSLEQVFKDQVREARSCK